MIHFHIVKLKFTSKTTKKGVKTYVFLKKQVFNLTLFLCAALPTTVNFDN